MLLVLIYIPQVLGDTYLYYLVPYQKYKHLQHWSHFHLKKYFYNQNSEIL